MENIAAIASKTIRPAHRQERLAYAHGDTPDIIAEILSVDNISKGDTVQFAQHLKARSHYETLRNVWTFVKDHIKYVVDPLGVQYIKTPARIWSDGYADCKGYSILIASLLKNLGYGFSYRFVSYGSRPVYTHVYIIVTLSGGHIPGNNRINEKINVVLDAVMPSFDAEKPYTFKKDVPMTKIVTMTGIGEDNSRLVKKVVNLGNGDISEISAGEMDLWIARDRMITEKGIVENMRGIGSLVAEKYQDSIDMLEDAILAVQKATVSGIGSAADPDLMDDLMDIAHDAVTGKYSIAHTVYGIGAIAGKAKRQEKKAERKQRREQKKAIKKQYDGKEQREQMAKWRETNGTKTGKFLQKVGKKVAQGVKAITRVLTAPQRLAMKAMLEVNLPKAAPMFLYLFVQDPKLIEKLPPKAREKRKKAEKISKVIIKGIGMKENHFMGIVRNGIMKQMGDSPENIIAKQMKGQLSGIGLVEEVGKAAGGFLTKIIDWIIGLFKNKKNKTAEEQQMEQEASEAMSDVDGCYPDPSSSEEQSEEVAEAVRAQENNTLNEESLETEESPAEDGSGSRRIWKSF